jgi:hypothetical protein
VQTSKCEYGRISATVSRVRPAVPWKSYPVAIPYSNITHECNCINSASKLPCDPKSYGQIFDIQTCCHVKPVCTAYLGNMPRFVYDNPGNPARGPYSELGGATACTFSRHPRNSDLKTKEDTSEARLLRPTSKTKHDLSRTGLCFSSN